MKVKECTAQYLRDAGFFALEPEGQNLKDISYQLQEGLMKHPRLEMSGEISYSFWEFDDNYSGSKSRNVYEQEYLVVTCTDGKEYRVAKRSKQIRTESKASYCGD